MEWGGGVGFPTPMIINYAILLLRNRPIEMDLFEFMHDPTFCAEPCQVVTHVVWHVEPIVPLGHPSPPRRHHCTMGVIRDAVVWKPY